MTSTVTHFWFPPTPPYYPAPTQERATPQMIAVPFNNLGCQNPHDAYPGVWVREPHWPDRRYRLRPRQMGTGAPYHMVLAATRASKAVESAGPPALQPRPLRSGQPQAQHDVSELPLLALQHLWQ